MSDALSTAVNGINSSVARTSQYARNIVNASSTGKNVDADLVGVAAEKSNVSADAAVLKTVDKMNKALLDITA